jgi:hypothetical protein
MIPRQMYKWAAVKIPSTIFEYCTAEDHVMKLLKKPSLNKNVLRNNYGQHHTYNTLAEMKSIKWKALDDL